MGAYLKWDVGGAGQLYFDVVLQETQNKSSKITEHMVEVGANITDNVRPNVDTVTLQGFVSNAPILSPDGVMTQEVLNPPTPPIPITLNGAITAGVNAIKSLFASQIVANVLEFPNATDYVTQAITTLDTLRMQATLVSVVCPSYTYEDMMIEEIEVSGSPDEGTGREFTVTLKQIRTVSSLTTDAPTPTTAVPRAKTTTATGSQAATPAPAQTSSVLSNLLGG